MITDSQIRGKIDEIVADEGDENFSLHVLHDQGPGDPGSPLLIVVHPGDASGEPGIDAALEDLTREVRRSRAASRILVLHRFSSSYPGNYPETDACDDWFSEVAGLGRDASHLYGDHLDQAADWVRQNRPVLANTPVIITGLWGDPEHGCAWAMARHLSDMGAVLSDHCPLAEVREPPCPS